MILPLCVERGIHVKTIVAAGLMMLASASFAAAPESARAKAARLALTEGISAIDSEGLPGPVLCLSEEAFPLGQCMHWEKTLGFAAAAAFYGEGRVAYFGHPAYLSGKDLADTPQLFKRLIPWLTKGKANPTIVVFRSGGVEAKFKRLGYEVKTVRTWPEAAQADLVLTYDWSLEDAAAMRDYVKRGGAILGGGLGWGWKQIVGRTQAVALGVNFADNQVLGPMGILMGDMGTPKPDGHEHFPVLKDYPESSYTLTALQKTLDGSYADKADKRQCEKIVSLTMDALPACATDKLKDVFAGFAKKPGADKVPTPEDPIGPNDFAAKLTQIAKKNMWQADVEKVWPADPAHVVYPGACKPGYKTVSREVSVDLRWPKWHSTGLYSPAGEALTITLPEGAEKLGLAVRIGTSKEDLTASKEFWKRAPYVSSNLALVKRTTTLASPYGGLVYIVVPEGCAAQDVCVKIEGAIAAPWFRRGIDTNESFAEQVAKTHAPMGELEGDWYVITLPVKSLARVKDAAGVVKFWDDVLLADQHLAQWPSRPYKERMCGDLQLEGGDLHNGYPMMYHLPANGYDCVSDLDAQLKGNGWGFYHEIGHNHQSADWTPDGTGEVTCNIFTTYVISKVCGQDYRDSRFGGSSRLEQEKRVNRWIGRGKKHEEWKNDYFVALEIFLRIADVYGFETYAKVFGKYREPGFKHPRTDVEKWDTLARLLSAETGENLAEAFAHWNLPVSDACRTACAQYKPANDEVTRGVDSRYDEGPLPEIYVPQTAAERPEEATGLYIGVSLTTSPAVIEQYPTRAAIPGGEQDIRWKTDWLLMRRIEATGNPVTLGAPDNRYAERQVELTRPYYIAVYELTQKQWANITGGYKTCPYATSACRDVRPQGSVSYGEVRGDVGDGIDWPKTRGKVAENSFLGKLRELVDGRILFDIPTEAEWEVACRAGSTNYWNDGSAALRKNREGYEHAQADLNLDRLGRYCQNGGERPGKDPVPPDDCGPEWGTAIVGSYLPNAWGLYDMHGNVREHCRDWLEPDPKQPGLAGVDPEGPAEESPRAKRRRMQKGGSYSNFLYGSAGEAASGARGFGALVDIWNAYHSTGVRLMMPAQIWPEARMSAGKCALAPDVAKARSDLMKGVSALKPSGFASPVLCFDERAIPLACGRNQDNTLAFAAAAADSGRGRIVVVGDEHGPAAFRQLNAAFAAQADQWLKAGADRSWYGVKKVKDVDLNRLAADEVEDLIAFVKNGGSVFVTGCVWRWQDEMEERTGEVEPVGDFPGNRFLAPFGLGLGSGGLRWMSSSGFIGRGSVLSGLIVSDAERLRKGKVYVSRGEEKQVAATLSLVADYRSTARQENGIPSETRVLPKVAYPKNANGIPVNAGDKIVFLGDSITRLGGEKDGWIDRVLAGLANAGVTDVEAVRAGWDGQHAGDMLGRIDGLLATPGVKWIAISCGVNDVWGFDWERGQTLPEYKRNVRAMLNKCAEARVHVLLLTPTLVQEEPDNEKNRILLPFADFIRAEAKARGLILVDVNQAELDGLKAAGFPNKKLYTYDGVHPVEAGHRLFAETILKALGVSYRRND